MGLLEKVQEYDALNVAIKQTNDFVVGNFSELTVKGNDGRFILTKKEWLGDYDISILITAIRNKATLRRTALKQEIIDILNSGA